MLDTASKIVALIISTIGAGTTIYKKLFNGERKRKKKYYESLLKPFIIEYRKNSTTDAIDFVISNMEGIDDAIPKYVFYLIDLHTKQIKDLSQQETTEQPSNEFKEKLAKILITDYLNLYPNEHTRTCSIYELVRKLLNYLLLFLSFVSLFASAFMISSSLLSFVTCFLSETQPLRGDLLQNFSGLFSGILVSVFGLILAVASDRLSEDMYTTKKKAIEKLVSKKIKRHDKRIDDYIL